MAALALVRTLAHGYGPAWMSESRSGAVATFLPRMQQGIGR